MVVEVVRAAREQYDGLAPAAQDWNQHGGTPELAEQERPPRTPHQRTTQVALGVLIVRRSLQGSGGDVCLSSALYRTRDPERQRAEPVADCRRRRRRGRP